MAHAKTAVAGITHGKPFYQSLYVQVLAAIVIGVALGTLSATWRADEAARRHVHQIDQDDHRSNHLLHRRAWHCQHARHEEGWPRRAQGAYLLRSHNDYRFGCRSYRREYRTARRWHERRCKIDRQMRGKKQLSTAIKLHLASFRCGLRFPLFETADVTTHPRACL